MSRVAEWLRSEGIDPDDIETPIHVRKLTGQRATISFNGCRTIWIDDDALEALTRAMDHDDHEAVAS